MASSNPARGIRPILLLLGGPFFALALSATSTTGTCRPDPRNGAQLIPAQSTERPIIPGRGPVQPENPSPLTPKQQRALLKANYKKMKQDADELAALAKSLQDDLNKSNENVLSLDVVDKADKIEKLAKKIKSAAVQ